MAHVVLVIHLILTLVLIGLVLIQRSEGGGLGIGGGGGGMGNFASPQSTANALTKLTTIVGVCFFSTSLILAIIAARGGGPSSILDVVDNPPAVTSTVSPGTEKTGIESESAPAPSTPAPAASDAPKPDAKTTAPSVPIAE